MTEKAIEIEQPPRFAVQRQVFSMKLSGRVAATSLHSVPERAWHKLTTTKIRSRSAKRRGKVLLSSAIATPTRCSSASETEDNATSAGRHIDAMAVFTIAKGGLMYAATHNARGTKEAAANP